MPREAQPECQDLLVSETRIHAQQLVKTGSGTQKAFDDAQMAVREAEARLNSSQTRLARRKVFSPADGTIQQIYYRPGEMVSSGRPVLSLLPPGNMKVRFFVPEADLPKFAYGETVGTLVKHETLDRDLVLDWLWVGGMWDRVGPAAQRARERLGADALYENFEALAKAQAG